MTLVLNAKKKEGLQQSLGIVDAERGVGIETQKDRNNGHESDQLKSPREKQEKSVFTQFRK